VKVRIINSCTVASAALVCMTAGTAHAAKVLVLSNNGEAAVAAEFAAKTVGHVYTPFNVSGQVPTLAQMNQHDAILLFENGNFDNAVAAGNAVAQFYNQGGKCVVLGTFYWQDRSDNPIYSNPGWGALESVDVFTGLAGGSEYNSDSMNPGSIVPHPVTMGVTSLSAGSYRGGVDAKPGTTVLATWLTPNMLNGSDPVIGIREDPNGGKFVGISIFPDYESHGDFGVDFSGDFYKLWENTFAWCASTCGNAVLGPGEACDDGNNVDGDGCTALCVKEVCGDGAVNNSGMEACDDGNLLNTDTCTNTCKVAACGDGFVQDGVEACDDGNVIDNDACTNGCALPSCGDNIKQGMEECDDGDPDNTDACLDTCVTASCGDGFVHADVETCDDSNDDNTDDCLDTCQAASCGDGFVQAGVEPCDDGNADDTDMCLGTCAVAICGDGFVFAGIEECDDGNGIDDDECANDCTFPSVGSSSDGTGGVSVGETTDGESTGGESSGGEGTTFGGEATGVESTGGSTSGSTSGETPTGTGDGDSNSGGGTDTGTPTSGSGPVDESTSSGTTSGSGTDTAGVDDEGCGCAAQEPTRGGWLGLLGLGLLFRRRRR